MRHPCLLMLVLMLCAGLTSVGAVAPSRGIPYAESICQTSPDVFFCEDFEGQDITCLGGNNCGSNWTNPAIQEKDICWCGGGSYQFPTIPTGAAPTSQNKVWRVSKSVGYTDVITGVNTGTGNGTIAGFLNQAIMGTGAREWWMRAQIYFHPTHTWPGDYDTKHALWALPRVFTDPPSAAYEAGLYVHQDFWCSGLGNFNDVPVIRYSTNFAQFPYQNEYCPPLATGQPANGTNAPRYQKGRWYTVEIHYKLGTSASTGQLDLWLDGTLAYSSSRATCTGSCGDMGYLMIMGWMNSADPQTGYLEMDNIVYSRAPIGVPGADPGGDTRAPAAPTNLHVSPVP